MSVHSEDKIKAKLDNEKARKIDNLAVNAVRKFYQENEPHITSCYDYYLQYKNGKENYIKNIQGGMEEFEKELKGEIILVLTANPIE